MKFNIEGFCGGRDDLSVLLSIIYKIVLTMARYEFSTMLGVDLA